MSSLRESIIEIAKRTGFESELKVAGLASAAGWKVQQNTYYIDKDERKGRELDIHIYKIFQADGKPNCFAQVNLCVEVKKTSEPFVFFSNESRELEVGMGWSLFNWSHNVDRHVLSYDDIEHARPNKNLDRIARSYMSMKDGKTQQIQGAILSSVKAAIHFKDECNEQYDEESRDVSFFVPVVVVDGEIYDCYFEDDVPELTVVKVDRLVYSQNYLSDSYGNVQNQVPVMTFDAFSAQLEAYAAWGESMIERMGEQRHLLKKAKEVGPIIVV